ncbi:MAG: PEGA domain-containing protein [Elusimicrobia bacterium]|nr:PEGA domain-containing protein [Elusimicrobiota bacterium]
MLKKVFSIFVCMSIISSIMFSGCATITKGSQRQITFNSEPSGAKIFDASSGAMLGKTPTSLKLTSKKDHSIKIAKDGYEPSMVSINNGMGTSYLVWDILLWGGFGLIVDGLTGAWNDLEPTTINTSLEATKK